MNRVQIQGKLCGFSHGFQEDGLLRQSMNQLTQAVYRFDFEDWHQSGRWKPEDCCPYALFEGEQAVSLLTANLIPFCWQGKPQRLLQLGTVCTLPEYRGHGLSEGIPCRPSHSPSGRSCLPAAASGKQLGFPTDF